MMTIKRKWRKRLCCMTLAACMLFSLLPMSVITMAAEADSVSVTWGPLKQSESGTRQVTLTASLVQSDGNCAAALIDISLAKAEADALQWLGASIDASDLPVSQQGGGAESDSAATLDDIDQANLNKLSQNESEQGMIDRGGESGQKQEAQVMTQVLSLNDGGNQAVLITGVSGGAVLRILLTNSQSLQVSLTFSPEFEDSTAVFLEITEIRYKMYVSEAPAIVEESLLTDNDGSSPLTDSGTSFIVYQTIPEEITVSAEAQTVDLAGEGSKDITYTISLQRSAVGEGGKEYTFTVGFPEGLSLPEGALSYNNGSVLRGDTEIAKMEYPSDATSSFSVTEGSLCETDNGFTFTVLAPQDKTAAEDATYGITLTLHADKLVRSAEAISGNVTLTVSAADADGGKTASVSVTAGGATLPGDGGWTVVVAETEDKSQNVFWRDNEQTSARPEGWDDRSFWRDEFKLYYTLTDQNGVTYTPTLLTNDEDALAKVGMDAYPTFAAYGSHGFTVKDLPTELKQTDPNDPDNVQNTYVVTWYLEAPESVDGYDFRDIQSDQVGAGSDYPSISTAGWYYMQKDTFTFTLDIRQGDEAPLAEYSEDKLRALLSNFQFNWSYTGGSGSNGINDMIEEGNAVPSYHDGVVEITGMWKYNVDGSPINYSVTEIGGEEADRKITADELGGVTGLLEENEWYQIQYVNTGVPGEGQDTAALHSGGTLQLVRQGNTQYQATKIWLDSYGDDPGARPNTSFTLYRYRKGEDPSTAAQMTGYSVQLSQKTDEEGKPTGGYAVQVMNESGTEAVLADLPKYDTLDGAEFIYVVRETLSGTNAGQYEQVFGTVSVDDETGEIIKTEDPLPEGALSGGGTERPSGDTYLYNNGTLTNYQTGTIPVSASKTWNAAAYQSQFDDVAVELTLQYRVKDSGAAWETYTTSSGEPVKRYLHRFYAESLSDTLVDRPSMPKYATTVENAANQELEYRWLETAVYTDAADATETDLGDAKTNIEIVYPVDGENSAAGETPIGSFTMNGSSYTVSYTGSANSTQITNSVSEYLNYEVIKEWRTGSTPKQITIQILRSVAGGDFETYLEFTMNAAENDETVTVTGPTTKPSDVSDEFTIQGQDAETAGSGDSQVVTWNALVSGLPRFDERGRPYEYLLLEAENFPVYQTKLDSSGNYTTTVINGGGGDGFNLLVRKVWLDDGDMEHRDPVTLTLYNKNNNQPITLDGESYTITLGGEGEENLWHKVVWIGTTGLGNTNADGGDGKFDADDVYLVETNVGGSLVDHHLEALGGNVSTPTYGYLYRERNDEEPIFEVTTDNHRYQVTYQQEEVDSITGGVGASFTITNRRLGNIDLTVTKTWVDGREGDTSQVLNEVKTVLEKYAEGNNTYLALAFRLVFDDSMGDTEAKNWEITYSGPSAYSDTVCVGGENAQIYSTYEKEEQKDLGYAETGSSEWIILGYVKDENGTWTIQTSDSARFLGLPKYDTDGEVVAYSVEEVWLDVTDAGVADDGTITPPKEVTLSSTSYPELYALWRDFGADYEWTYTPDADNSAHSRDEQTLEVTNARRGTKTVQWTVVWRDEFTNNSNLRPDIYLDIYQVTYIYEEETGTAIPVISRVTGRTIDWDMEKPGSWTATLSGVPAFDEKGNEIFYYAVQRTVMAAGDYDYQAALYEMNGTELGTRDEPASGVETLNNERTSITNDSGQPYDLAVLGKRNGDETDTVDSIQWSGDGQPAGIGLFGNSSNYPKYALLEGGTIINTLAENYTIEGVKYWTNLPTGWEDTRLPQVTFTVSRYAENENTAKEVAKAVISSELWQELKSGTQYKYLIQYEGINVLGKDEDGNVCVTKVLDMDTEAEITNPTPLARYEAETGALWTYTVEETIDWGEGSGPVAGDQIFKTTPGGFTFTNSYEPTEGSIQVKKFLYLPGEETVNDAFTPSAYPAVTFKLTRQVSYGDDEDGNPVYVADESFGTQTVTISSGEVQEAWSDLNNEDQKAEGYVTLYALFEGLDLYAPNGTKYQYTVIEDRDELKGYTTWAEKGNKDVPDAVTGNGEQWTTQDSDDYPNSGITDGVKIGGLEPTVVTENNAITPAATFKNQRTDPPQKYENSFTATKAWDDNDNAYGFRPEADKFKELLEHVERDLTTGQVTWTALKRTAASQTGQGNGITEYLIPDVDFTVEVTDSDGNYTITIRPKEGTAFDLYAPNGRPWVYSFSEPTVNNRLQLDLTNPDAAENSIYAPPANTGGTWTTKIQPTTGTTQNTDFGTLTNTTHMSYQFTKEWVDANEDEITENYLGEDFKLTVTFRLQVSDDNKTTWTDASTYFAEKEISASAIKVTGATQGTDGAWDTATITATVDASDWSNGGAFTQLPTVLKNEDENGTVTYTFLQYRVVETAVAYGGTIQTITGPEAVTTSGSTTTGSYTINGQNRLVTGAAFTRYDNQGISTSTNTLSTTEISVTKVWDDNDNQYGTRPGGEGPWSWASWFVLQRSTDNTTWENVAVFEKLYGSSAESGSDTDPAASGSWTATITGLPAADYSSGTVLNYTYRVRELQPKEGGYTSVKDISEGDIVEPNGTYNPNGFHYTATYAGPTDAYNLWTVTNSMDTPTGEVPKNVAAIKVWAGDEENGTVTSITFQLEYKTEEADWAPAEFLSDDQWEKAANASNGWKVQWDDLPETDGGGSPVTGYRVVEAEGSGWVQIAKPKITTDEDTNTTTYRYTFTNSITTSYSVEKVWRPADATTAPVTLGLYRTTVSAKVGSTSGTPVPVDELDSSKGVQTVTLSENTWTHTFTNLPKYDANGDPYYYYALELNGTTPIGQNGTITLNAEDYEVSYDWTTEGAKTTVTNTTATSLTGTKTWVDNGNAYNTRPDSLTLILERRANTDGAWDDVSDLYAPAWDTTTGAAQNQWTYTYTGLPSCDKDGNTYTYRVREVVPSGYALENQKTGGADGEVNKTDGNYDFTNTLSGTVTITGRKIWSGGVGTTEPTLTLERRLSGQTQEAQWTTVSGNPTWSKPEGSSIWTFTYTNLDKYDGSGVLYEYRVREEVPDGYEACYKTDSVSGTPATSVDGLTITNYKDGSLTVSKTVSGNRGDQTKDFTFTVTLTGDSSAGTAADSIHDTFDTSRTAADGTTASGSITFTDGVSEEFTLKHGESLTIEGLPAGIGYQVTEKEANQDGYSTTGTGWTGSIPAGGTIEAKFNNYSNDSGGGGDADRTDLTGRKTWVDKGQNDPKRPDDITLELYRKITGGTEERVYAQPTWVKNGNTWTYTFHNLPKADEDGNSYTYRVSEVVPEGYEASQSGNNITNRSTEVEPGSLLVSKQVTGSRGDPTREFTFTVTLSNEDLTGTYGQMTFVNGVATFTLRDGESLRADNLPAGTTYTVTEKEANQDGYTTTATGDAGTIAADATASAVFTNYRPGSDPDPDPESTPDPDSNLDPGDPDFPDNPDVPDALREPDVPSDPEGAEVPTGDRGNMALYGALMVLFAVGLSVTLYLARKTDRKKGGKRPIQ